MNKRSLLVTLLFVFIASRVIAQDVEMLADETLPGIRDVSGANVDRDVITDHYRSLNIIYINIDNRSSALEKQQISDKRNLYCSVQELVANQLIL